MNVLIYGGGAVGLGLASCLIKAGLKVDIIARQDTVRMLQKEGLRREGIFGEMFAPYGLFKAYTSLPELSGDIYKYVLVCTKASDSAAVAEDIFHYAHILGEGGVLLLCQNGWGGADSFLEYFKEDKIFNARIITGFTLLKQNQVKITVHADAIHLGSLFPADISILNSLSKAITMGGIECISVNNIAADLWAKMLYNCALNSIGALFGVPYGVMGQYEESRAIMNRIIKEVFEVMTAAGYSTHWREAEEYIKVFYERLLPATAEHESSTLQDIRKGKPTEIDALNGAVVRLGEKCGIPTPANSLVYDMVRFRSKLSSGTGKS